MQFDEEVRPREPRGSPVWIVVAAIGLAILVVGVILDWPAAARVATGPVTYRDRLSLTAALLTARSGHASLRLADGTVLMAGGANGAGLVPTSEVYTPATAVFLPTRPIGVPR